MDTEPLTTEANSERVNKDTLLNHRVIKRLSVVIIIVGVVSVLVGIGSFTFSLVVKCTYHYDYSQPSTAFTGMCSYNRTFTAPGIWCGLMYITTGIIGIFASKRRTVCFIVTLMVMTVVSNWVALCGMVLSIGSHFDQGYHQLNNFPLTLHILNSFITLTSLAAFIVQWIEFGYTSRAVCCNGEKGYPKMKENRYTYAPLASQPTCFYHTPTAPVANTTQLTAPLPNSNYQAPNAGPMNLPGHNPEAIYLVKDGQVIGVLPQNLLATQTQVPGSAHS